MSVRMKKPYVICHMMSSVDGRIVTSHWGKIKGMDQYESTGKKLKGDAWMCGRVTMEMHFAGKKPLKPDTAAAALDRKDFIAPHKAKSFAVAVDAGGKLNWNKSSIDKDHIISVLTESVSDDYLYHLQKTGVSYIFGGKTEIDFKLVLNKLAKLFPIKILLLEGGGGINGSMLNAGLIDELSFLYVAVADGIPGTPTYFDVDSRLKKAPPAKLSLLSVKKLADDVIWTRYKVR